MALISVVATQSAWMRIEAKFLIWTLSFPFLWAYGSNGMLPQCLSSYGMMSSLCLSYLVQLYAKEGPLPILCLGSIFKLMIMASLRWRPDDEQWLQSQSITSLVKTLREAACKQSPVLVACLQALIPSWIVLAIAFHAMLEAAFMFGKENGMLLTWLQDRLQVSMQIWMIGDMLENWDQWFSRLCSIRCYEQSKPEFRIGTAILA